MLARPAFQQLGKIAQKWRKLAEKRREHFAELYRSGRWKLYYTEDELLVRMRDVVGLYERWAKIAPPRPEAPADAGTAVRAPALVKQRDAA